MAKSFSEQIAALKATRAEKHEQMKAVAQASIDEQRSMDTAEAEQFDALKSEIKRLDDDISRLSVLADMEKTTLAPVTEEKSSAGASVGVSTLQVKHQEKLEPGIGFARIARVKALSKVTSTDPLQIAMNAYPDDKKLHESFSKAAVAAARTDSPAWAGSLILDSGAYFGDFVEHLRANTVLGQIGNRLRRLPFDTQVLVQSTGGRGAWVGEGASKPVTAWSYRRTKLEPLKVAAIAAATKEQLMRSSVAADALIRDELTRAIGATIDATFVNDDAGSSGVSPAGIRSGVVALSLPSAGSAGADAESVRCDIAEFLKTLATDNLTVAGAFWLMPETVAIDLAMMTNAVGAQAFPGMTPTGGTLAGLPVFTSQYLETSTHGSVVMLIKGDDIYLGDEGGVQVAMSDQASIQMDDQISSITGATVSMFQTNSVAFLVERFINFERRRDESVVWASVNWGCA